MDLFVIISEKLYCSRLNRCGQFEKSEKKYVFRKYTNLRFQIQKKKIIVKLIMKKKIIFFFI